LYKKLDSLSLSLSLLTPALRNRTLLPLCPHLGSARTRRFGHGVVAFIIVIVLIVVDLMEAVSREPNV
jgi:hypothetical protein